MDVPAWTSAERPEAGSTVYMHASEPLTEERQDCKAQGGPQSLPHCSITTEAAQTRGLVALAALSHRTCRWSPWPR